MKTILPLIGLCLLLSACYPQGSVRSRDGYLKEVCYNGVRCIIVANEGISCDFSRPCDIPPMSHD